MKNLSESIIMNLNEEAEKKYPIVSPSFEDYGDYGSITLDDAKDSLDELVRFYNDFNETAKADGFSYQGVNLEKLEELVGHLNKAKEVLAELADDCK